MANNKGNQNTKPNLASYSLSKSARAASDTGSYKCFVAIESSCLGTSDLPNQGNPACLDNHGKHPHLGTGDSSNQANPSHTESKESSNQANPSETEIKDSSNQDNPSHTESKESPNQAMPSHAKIKDSSNLANLSHTESKESYNKANPSHTQNKESYNKANPSHTESKESYNKANPSHTESKESYKKANPSHTESKESYNKANPSHTQSKESSNQAMPSNTECKDSSNQANPSHTEIKDSSNQANPSHTQIKESSNQANPSHSEIKDSSNQANPSHTEIKDSSNQANPSHTEIKDSSNQANPSHTEIKDSSNQANPSHTESKESPNQAMPSHAEIKDSPNLANLSHTESKESYNKANPSHTESKESSNQANPSHTEIKDSSNQANPSHTEIKDSSNQANPSHTENKELSNQANPSHTEIKDSSNQANPSQIESKDLSDNDNQYQHTVDSLILLTSHPGVSSSSNSYVKDGAVATEPMSDTSDLEESKLDVVSKTKTVTLHDNVSGADTNNDKSLTNEFVLISTIDSFNEVTAFEFAKLTTNNISLEKDKNPCTSELEKESKQSKFKDASCLDKTKDIFPQSEHTVAACASSRQTKSFTLTDEHIHLLECLGFKEHCEAMFSGLTMKFNKEENCIILESTVDCCQDVEIEILSFLRKCKKHSWELDCMQTILLNKCTSLKARLIEFFHKNHIYCCFDHLNKVISICAKSEDDLQKYEKWFCENVHCERFYFDPHEDQDIESYLVQLQMRFKEKFCFIRATDGKVNLVCLSSISKNIIKDIKLHFNLSEDDITHPEMLSVNMNQMQNNNDLSVDPILGAHSTNFIRSDTSSDNQSETDYSVDDKQKKSEGSLATESHFMSHFITDVSEKGILQATNQGCLVDGKSVCLTEILAKHESQSSSTQNAETNLSAQPLPASVTDGLIQNTMDSAVMLNDSVKSNEHVNVEKGLQSKDQHSQNEGHNKAVLPEPNMHAEQKTNTLQLTKLEAKLISHPKIQQALILVFYERKQNVVFHPAEEFLEIEIGDQTIVKEIMASEIHTEQIAADKDEQALDAFLPYLVKTYNPELRQITIVFHRKIEKDVLPIINHLKLNNCCCIFPLCVTSYTMSYLTQIVESQFPFKIDIEVICNVLYGISHLKITTEKTRLEEVKSTVDHLLKTIQIKKMVLTPHAVNRILSSQGQQYLMQLEEKHKCQINVVSSDCHLFMRASCSSGHKLFMMEGTMATADCQILVLPLCDGQKQWPSQYKSILEKSFLTTDMGQYSGIRTPPTPYTLSLECNGEAKGQTVVVMYIPSRNFNDSIAKACEIILSEISGKTTIAMPLELSTDISYKESLPVILQVIREHTLKNENKPFSVFFYAGDQTLQTLQEITGFVETLLGKEEKFPPWKTNIPPLGPYHRVKIMEADLEKVKADVIVNSTDPGLLHKNGAVSNALLKAAGPEMADQCRELYPGGIGNRILVTTDSFHLGGVKAIFHIVLPQEPWSRIPKTGSEELRRRVKACLIEASNSKYESIAFPALGVGRLEYPPNIVAQTMFTAATDFFLRMPESTIDNVYFVCHPSDKKAVRAFKMEEQKQKKKLQRPEEEQNECKEYLLSVRDYKLQVIKSDEQSDPILTDVIIVASGSQASIATDQQRNNSEKRLYIQTQAETIQHVFKSIVDFKWCRSVGIILDTFDDKWYSEILNAVGREIDGKSNLQFILFVQDRQKLDVLQKLTGGKCEPIQVEKNKKAKKEKTENKKGMIHICGPEDEIEQAMTKLKEMQVSKPSNQPLPKASDDKTTFENTQQNICSLIIPRAILKQDVPISSSLTDVQISFKSTVTASEFQIKCDSFEKAKAGIQYILQQISNVHTEHSSLHKSEKSDSSIQEIDCLIYDALEYIFGHKFTTAFGILHKDTKKVTLQIPNTKAQQVLEEKIASLRQEDLPLSSHEMEVLGNSVDGKSENIDVFIKLVHDQNKAVIFGCDYNAVSRAKHLVLVKCGRTKLTNRAKRQFAAGSGDPVCNQTSMQNTGATSSGIGLAKDFVTKSGIKISVYKADITQLTVNAIVNAANENLVHGGGVAYAIAKAAGPNLEVEGDEYVRKFGPLKVSEIVKTTAGRLPCQAVLHAVGPRWDDYQNKDECKQALQQTVYNCLRKSHDLNYTSLAVTSISSAIFGVPKVVCADSYLAALQSFENQYGRNTSLQHIHFVDINDGMIGIIQDTFSEKWDTPVAPNYVQQSFGDGVKLKSGDGIALESSSVILGKTKGEPVYQCNFSGLCIFVEKQHISETNADAIVLWQEPGKPFEDTTSQQVLKAMENQLLAKEITTLKRKLIPGCVEMITTSKNQLIVFPVMTNFIMNTNDVCRLMITVFNRIDLTKRKSVAISGLPYTRQKEFSSVSKDLEEFTSGLCTAIQNYAKNSGLKNCIYIYDESPEHLNVMVDVISMKVREFESRSTPFDGAGKSLDGSYLEPVNTIPTTCTICLDEIINSEPLSCGHTFCKKCIKRWLAIKNGCPFCKSALGLLIGDQPIDGQMEIEYALYSLKGYASKDCFKITYNFPSGIQRKEHPNPGKRYTGVKRYAYIPNTEEGRKVLVMLKVAFDRRLVFTLGTSATSGLNDVIIWNGIHHKTHFEGGVEHYGYPDATYLTRVQQELKDVGVTVRDLTDKQKDFIQHPEHYINKLLKTVSLN